MSGLSKGNVDVFPAGLDTRPASHQGVQGRIKQAINAQATRYEHTSPPKYLLEPRDGFERLTGDVRSTSGADLGTIERDEASLLGTVNDQLIDISDRVPRVFTDPEVADRVFVEYTDVRVVTNKLTEETITGGYGISQAASNVIMDGVQAACWTETGGGQRPRLVFGLKQVDGPWIVPPYVVFTVDDTAPDGYTTVGKVRTDGTRFVLVFSIDANGGTHDFLVKMFDIHGVQVASNSFLKNEGNTSPGHWDVIQSNADPTLVLLAQPAANTGDPAVDVNVELTSMQFVAGLIVLTQNTDTSIACNGPVAWIKNDRDSFDYLETRGPVTEGDAFGTINLYRIEDLAQTVTYKPYSLTGALDAMAGYYPATDTGETFLFSVVGLAEDESTTGPQWNPQLRTIQTWKVEENVLGASPVLARTSHQQALATRSFALGEGNKADYLHATFYQSGQGYQTPTPIVPTLAPGDFFYGSPSRTLNVVPGDNVRGSPIPVTGTWIRPSTAAGAVAMTAPDHVAAVTSTQSDHAPLLAWTIASLSMVETMERGRLRIAGTGSTKDGDWDIVIDFGDGKFYTPTTAVDGHSLSPGTLTTGTAAVVSMTAYYVPDLPSVMTPAQVPYYIGGAMVVTGSTSGVNNGTKTVAKITLLNRAQSPTFGSTVGPIVLVVTGSEVLNTDGFAATIAPGIPNTWFLSSPADSSAIGGTLVVTGDVNPGNNGSFPVTDVFGATLGRTALETDGATGLVTEVIASGAIPTITLELGADQFAYTFFIADLADDLAVNPQRFVGATLNFVSADFPANNGDYRIIGFDPALDGTIYTERVVTDESQVSENLDTSDAVVIYLAAAPGTQPFQPSFFLTPAEGSRPFVGQFDRLLAYNDWRFQGANLLDGHLADIAEDVSGGLRFLLPTRQEVVPELVATTNQVVQSSTVGVKSWALAATYGTMAGDLIPGAAAVSFEDVAWPEDGFALAPEAPWFANQGTADPGQLGLTPNQTYVYQFVWESQDEKGGRVFSPPSPPCAVRLTGTNNQAVVGGVPPTYWLTTPTDRAGHTGITNRTPVAISVYRTAISNGVTTVQKYKLTSDLNPNGLSPASDDDESGFIFGGGTFLYVDQNADQIIQQNEPLYAGLPKFGAPNFTAGCDWQDRRWLITSDGSIWFSSSLTDGVRQSYFPGLRIAPPPGDRPVAVAGMDRYLVVIGERYTYWLPGVQLPDASGSGGTIPSLVRLPFPNGGYGLALPCAQGVLYDSTAGGLWLVTRDLQNVFFSQALTASVGDIVDVAIDGKQRLVLSMTEGLFVYDFVAGMWSQWSLNAGAGKLAIWRGRTTVRDTALDIDVQIPGRFNDQYGASVFGIGLDVTFAGISFASVRAFVRLYRFQIIGEYRGPHQLAVTISYPDDFPADPTVCPVKTPDPTKPYLLEANPAHQKCSQFEIRIAGQFDGIESPGSSFALELLSCSVGLDPGKIHPLPAVRRFG